MPHCHTFHYLPTLLDLVQGQMILLKPSRILLLLAGWEEEHIRKVNNTYHHIQYTSLYDGHFAGP